MNYENSCTLSSLPPRTTAMPSSFTYDGISHLPSLPCSPFTHIHHRLLLPHPDTVNLDHLMPPPHMIVMFVTAIEASYAKFAARKLAVESQGIDVLARVAVQVSFTTECSTADGAGETCSGRRLDKGWSRGWSLWSH
jgi:hypothetical protein